MVYTVPQLAKETGLSKAFWYSLIRTGHLEAGWTGGRYVVHEDDLRNWRYSLADAKTKRFGDVREDEDRDQMPDRKDVGQGVPHKVGGAGVRERKARAIREEFEKRQEAIAARRSKPSRRAKGRVA